MAYKQQKFISHSSGGWKVQDQGSGRFSFWCGPASWLIDLKSLIQFLRTPPPNTTTLGIKFQHEFERNTNIQSVVQSLSCVWLFAAAWTVAHEASLSLTPSPGVHPSSCPLNRRCHPTISSSATLFSVYSSGEIERNWLQFKLSVLHIQNMIKSKILGFHHKMRCVYSHLPINAIVQ